MESHSDGRAMLTVTPMSYPIGKGRPDATADSLWTAQYGDGPKYHTDCPLRAALGALNAVVVEFTPAAGAVGEGENK